MLAVKVASEFESSTFHPPLLVPRVCLVDMATPVILGVSAIAAAVLGRSLIKQGMFVGKKGAEQFVKGGFRAKMDRKEAIAILGLK